MCGPAGEIMKERAKGTTTRTIGYYPPISQMIGDLSPVLSYEAANRARLRAPVGSEVSTDQGTMHVGVMAALMDVLGGGLALTAFAPDWAATTHLSVQSRGRAFSGSIEARGEVHKTGRNMVLVKIEIGNVTGGPEGIAPVATAMIGFTRFSPREGSQALNIDPVTGKMAYANIESEGLDRPFYEKAGLTVLDEAEGLVQVEAHDYIRNSFGALHGGVVALLADLSGQTAARSATGKPLVTTDLTVNFVSLGEKGPFQARATVLRKMGESVLSLVEIRDMGAEGRIMSFAVNLAASCDLG